MKTLIFLLFLTIFCTACEPEDIETLNQSSSTKPRGESVMNESFCTRVSLIDPIVEEEIELPNKVEPFRNFCEQIKLAPIQSSHVEDDYFECQWQWPTQSKSSLKKLRKKLISLVGKKIARRIEVDGDLRKRTNRKEQVFQSIFLSEINGKLKVVSHRSDLWPLLSQDLLGLEDLQWRFALQNENSSLCSESARWGYDENLIFVENVEKCSRDGQQVFHDYLFDLQGNLLEVTARQSPNNHLCRHLQQ